MSQRWNLLIAWFRNLTIADFWNPQGLILMTPNAPWKFVWVYTSLVVVLLLGGILATVLKIRQPLKDRLGTFFWINFIIGAFLLFFRWQEVPLLGMDVWRLVQEVAMVIWLVILMTQHLRQRPQEVLAEKVSDYRNKYLPKPKKSA